MAQVELPHDDGPNDLNEEYPPGEDYPYEEEEGGGDDMQQEHVDQSQFPHSYSQQSNYSNQNYNNQSQNNTPSDFNNEPAFNNPQQTNYNNQSQQSKAMQDFNSDHTFNIYVGSLSNMVDEQDLATTFASCGEIVSTRVFRDKNTGEHMVY